MELHTQIKEELKDALKTKDDVRLRTVRALLTAFTNELVANGKTPQDTLSDDDVLGVVKRLAKQRKESIEQYETASRDDLAQKEKEELEILEGYLPQMMSRDEIRPIALAKKKELGVSDPSKMGVLIGAVMKELGGKADGADVKTIVEEILRS